MRCVTRPRVGWLVSMVCKKKGKGFSFCFVLFWGWLWYGSIVELLGMLGRSAGMGDEWQKQYLWQTKGKALTEVVSYSRYD